MNIALMNIGFLRITIVDVLDILMVAVVIYVVFKWIKGSAAFNIFIAILSLLLLRFLVNVLNMKMMSALLGTVIDIGTIALVVIFQPEIRRFLFNLGRKAFYGRNSLLRKFFQQDLSTLSAASIDEVVQACFEMGEQKVGALIVIPHQSNLEDIISTGDVVDAHISKRLIENIFFKNSPLHDGAMIINEDKIVAARCTLPISDRTDIPARFGMRHKAAIGVSERYDVSVIVVSEQTGKISFINEGKISPVDNVNTLKLLISDDKSKNGSEDRL
ncbi:MAG: diadenylate cyclase CdaA [Candidatus Cryptobacteroides sp.]